MTADQVDEDRAARMTLAAVSEPADIITGTFVGRIGPVETLELLATRTPLPAGVEPAQGELWRQRLAPRLNPGQLDRIQADMQQHDLHAFTPADAVWPVELRQLGPSAPLALWLRGDSALLGAPLSDRVAIVGARAATAYGTHIATTLSSDLVRRGRVIVSGGSYGIDAAAHRGANGAAPGRTIAVLASGLDRPQPSAHDDLFAHIVEAGGLLVAELPPGAAPTRWRFLQRARLIATLSGATVVVEAGRRSAALNVASLASALGRPVAAIPGPLTSPTSAGTHRLIQDGTAALVADADDVTVLIDPAIRFAADRPQTYSRTRRGIRPTAYLVR
ncbi:DNA-processing protein DprA [Agromyces sp. ISL-38]|uniref:DNA-processing protein DprA n=1 Tax=Agromyces sp. ISL-38 TaxID=2819107 RepID=UPI001BE56803|nr:DNA-processing protein DprA [Agromyces sp. ISL-38]MBT2498530.1 DNA-processing protein DprA [Agromyces sp. ISL-38]